MAEHVLIGQRYKIRATHLMLKQLRDTKLFKMVIKTEGVIWVTSLFIRFLWITYPQTGYIHPDEFFQSPEIVAGDVFGFQTLRTWEFNESFPIRSVLLPQIFAGIPFRALLQIKTSMMDTPCTFSTRELVVVPRFMLCVLSLIIDLCCFKISSLLGIDPGPVLAVIGTSYVTLVFNTRPFSNTLESVLFALILWFLSEYLFSKEKAKARIVNIGIGMVVVAGVWNRPTFLAYALIPSMAWFYSFFRHSYVAEFPLLKFVKEACFIGIGAIFSAILFITADSIYFGRLSVTPINFIKYNLDPSVLKEHGLHPRFNHSLVNMPLLFGVLAIIYYHHIIAAACTRNLNGSKYHIIYSIKHFTVSQDTEKVKLLTSKILLCKVLSISAAVPIGLLSLIPHQEPRFLTPILIPLAIIFSHVIVGTKQSPLLASSWFIWNAIGCLLFGTLHQGGMYSCLQFLQANMPQEPSGSRPVTYHIVFSNTYMPPRHLLAWPTCSGENNCLLLNKLVIHDLGGLSREKLHSWLNKLVKSNMDKDKEHQVFVVCPSTVYFHHHNFYKIREFFPHLTMEDPPNIASLLDFSDGCEERTYGKSCSVGNERQSYWQFLSSWLTSNLSLNLYEYKRNSDVSYKSHK